MAISQQVESQPSSNDTKVVYGPTPTDAGSAPGGAGATAADGSAAGGSASGAAPTDSGGAAGADGQPPASGGSGSTPVSSADPSSGSDGSGTGGSTPGGSVPGGSTPGGSGTDGSTPTGSNPADPGSTGSTPPGNTGDGGGTAAGDGTGLAIGVDHVATVGLGGQDGNGLAVNVLADPDSGDTHGLNVNLLENNGEHLLDVGALPDTGGLPDIGGSGAGDALGNVVGADGPLGGLLGNDDGGLLNATLGNQGDASSGHLVGLDVGPQTADGLGLDVLSAPGGGMHAISLDAIDTGANGPQLLDAGLLTGASGLGLPDLGGAGAGDALGNLAGTDGLLGNPIPSGNGPLITAALGDQGASPSGHLIGVDAGPQTTNGLGLDVLSAPGGDTHTVSLDAVDVGANGPQLLDAGVLTGAGLLDIPSLGGTGSDALAGVTSAEGGLLNGLASGALNGDIASGNSVTAPLTAPVDIGALTDAAPLAGDHGILDLQGAHIL